MNGYTVTHLPSGFTCVFSSLAAVTAYLETAERPADWSVSL